jgi:ribokinase/sulfofructose kinase
MAEPFDAIVYGMICIDTIWRMESLPPPGGYARVLEERRTIGGEAANSAIALSRWGVRVALLGNALGDDADGHLLRELFAREAPEIDTRFLTLSPDASTPSFYCIATSDGHRTTLGHRYATTGWPSLDRNLVRSARALTVDPYARDLVEQACAMAREEGLAIIAMDCARSPAINTVASIAVTSYENIGRDASPEALAEFAAATRDQYGLTAIVTMGENGCLVAPSGRDRSAESWQDTGGTIHVPAYAAPAIVDSTGSGDIFRAGLVYGQLQKWDLLRSVKFASAAAALNCGGMGGWGGVRSVEAIEAFQRASSPRS